MAEEMGTESEVKAERSLKEELRAVLESSPNRASVDKNRRMKQNAIIDNLPDDFWLDIKGGLLASCKEQKEIFGRRDNIIDLGRVKGMLFEVLVRLDHDICGEEETILAGNLRQFMRLPERYDLPAKYGFFQRVRIPDLAKINEKGEICGWVECKSGLLYARSFYQLSEGGFKRSFLSILHKLAQIPDNVLTEHGLESITGENKRKLKLAKKLDLVLAVPFGNYRPNDENGEILPTKFDDFPSCVEIEELIKVLSAYRILESPFSWGEINKLAAYLFSKVEREGQINKVMAKSSGR